MIIQNIPEPIPEDILRSEWVFALLMLPLLIYLIVTIIEEYSLASTIKIVFSNKFAQVVYRKLTPGIQLSQVLLGILSIISISTFFLFLEIHFDVTFFNLKPFILWLFNMFLVSVVILFRYVAGRAVGSLSRSVDAFREYIFNLSRNYKLAGILLMVLNFLISYLVSVPDKYIIYLALFFVSIIFIFRVIRLVYIFLIRRFSLFYLILYLCTLEFFPALILIRYLSSQAQ